ncbi:response regulator [Balneola vulgaris]|jgi:CheY-like chemotaxis protein|uniref:response regulator n=1 Tax=Balneola vulgaris TaxID=287535 RepID=UPI000377BAFD|nr:response regulator [Balneola vulgaris]
MSASRKQVLVVEDNLLVVVLYRQFLPNLNCDIVAEVRNGADALDVFRSKKVDLIIMDIMIEGEVDGVDTVKTIREESEVPVIFISGNSDTINFDRVEGISNSTFLPKPASLDEFVEAMDQVDFIVD